MTDQVAELARRRNDLPGPDVKSADPLPKRLLKSWWTWAVVALTLLYVGGPHLAVPADHR